MVLSKTEYPNPVNPYPTCFTPYGFPNTYNAILSIQFKPKFKIVCNYYKKASYKQFKELCSGLLEQVQIICCRNCYNVLLRMPSSVKYLMTKVQAFYCNIILLSLSCNCYPARLEDLPWLAELSRSLQTNILFIISVKDVKEIVVGTSHYGPEREISSRHEVFVEPVTD